MSSSGSSPSDDTYVPEDSTDSKDPKSKLDPGFSETLIPEQPPESEVRSGSEATLIGAMSEPGSADDDESPAAQMVLDGRYSLLKKIGEGGMGEVWIAQQSEPVRRQVAVKLIRGAGVNSRSVLLRFEAERQALALMDHPSIARVYDGGSTPDGHPYFVMEFVRGMPLTEYCDSHRLSVEERLRLFVTVCQAVQHAHQKGIIHRDLKPGNILVTEVDGRPTPKVIDFGVAKATEQKLTDQSLAEDGLVVGTPAYMSPEQADPSLADIDTRTDVYALGVILYELLAGSPPIRSEDFRRGAVLEMLRMVREVEPPRPSTRLSTADALPSIAANRSVEPARLTHLLRSELDWIVMKAIEKHRGRRYETASGFARDVQNYLEGAPVDARPPSTAYRFSKFVRRHRIQVVAVSLVLFAMVAGIIVASLGMYEAKKAGARESLRAEEEKKQRIRATDAEAKAKENEAKALDQLELANALTDFLTKRILAQASGTVQAEEQYTPKPDLTIREALDRAAKNVSEQFGDRPRVEAAIRHTLGISYREVSAFEESARQLEKALEIRKATLGATDSATLETMVQLGGCYEFANRTADAVKLWEQLLEIAVRKHGADHAEVRTVQNNLAKSYLDSGQTGHAIDLLRRVSDAEEKVHGLKHRSTLETLANLADALTSDKQDEEALKIYSRINDPFAEVLGTNHPQTLRMQNAYAAQLCNVGQMRKGLSILEDVSRRAVEHYGNDSHDALQFRQALAEQYTIVGRIADSIRLLEELEEDALRVLGPEHVGVMIIRHNLAKSYVDDDRMDDAIQKMEEVTQHGMKHLGVSHPETIKANKFLGFLYWQTQAFGKAVVSFRNVVDGAKQQWGEKHEETCAGAFNLAFNYVDNEQPEEAARVYQEWIPHAIAIEWKDRELLTVGLSRGLSALRKAGIDIDRKPVLQRLLAEIRLSRETMEPAEYSSVLAQSGVGLLEIGELNDAETVLSEALELRRKHEPDNWATFSTESMLGDVYLGQKKYDQAEPLLLSGYRGMETRLSKIPDPARFRVVQSLERLVRFYEATGKPEEVMKWSKTLEEFRAANPAER